MLFMQGIFFCYYQIVILSIEVVIILNDMLKNNRNHKKLKFRISIINFVNINDELKIGIHR